MNVRRTTLFIAIILAIGTGWLTLSYLSSIKAQNADSSQTREVIVAASDIPARSPITADMLARAQRPASAVDPDAISDERQAVGSLALITIPAGGAISASKIGRAMQQALPVRLRPGMRAVSIAIDRVKGVSGLAQPGDLVDVIAVPPRASDAPPPAATILRGVRVLAIGDTLEYSQATPSPQEANSTTITLEVTPAQADILAMADVDTTLRLALRSPREKIDSKPPETLRFPAEQTAAAAPAAAAPAAAADPPPQRRGWVSTSDVLVLDGTADGDSRGGSSEP